MFVVGKRMGLVVTVGRWSHRIGVFFCEPLISSEAGGKVVGRKAVSHLNAASGACTARVTRSGDLL